MLESGLSGSVRGVPSNGHPYRDPRPNRDMRFPSAPSPVRRHSDRSQIGVEGRRCKANPRRPSASCGVRSPRKLELATLRIRDVGRADGGV